MSDFPWQDAWDDLYAKGMHELGMSEPDAQVYADRHADELYEQRKEAKVETTICAKCRWLHGTAKEGIWWAWLCAAAPNATINPVCGTIDPPFHRCVTINRGRCGMYEAGVNALAPKKETVHV